MSDPKCARMLLEAAGRDLEVLRLMAREGSDEVFGFHVQQAAEKGLQSWIAVLGETYPVTHDIAALLDPLVAQGVDVDSHRRLAAYTPYAVAFRYEGVDPDSDPLPRDDALARVESLLAEVRGTLLAVAGQERGPPETPS